MIGQGFEQLLSELYGGAESLCYVVGFIGIGVLAVIANIMLLLQSKAKREWEHMMKASGIKNSLDETFKLKKAKKLSDGILYIVKIPYGLTEKELENIKNVLKSNFAKNVDIKREPNEHFISITIKDFEKKSAINDSWLFSV